MSAQDVAVYIGSCLAIGGGAGPKAAEACGIVLSNWSHVVGMFVGVCGIALAAANFWLNWKRKR